jgi:hypothetical protein
MADKIGCGSVQCNLCRGILQGPEGETAKANKCAAGIIMIPNSAKEFVGIEMPNLVCIIHSRKVQLDTFVLHSADMFVSSKDIPAENMAFVQCGALKQIVLSYVTDALVCENIPFLVSITGTNCLSKISLSACPFVYISKNVRFGAERLKPLNMVGIPGFQMKTDGFMTRSPSSGYKVRCWLQRARNLVSRKDRIATEVLTRYGILSVLLPIIFGYRF